MNNALSSSSSLGQEAARKTATTDQGEDEDEENDANDDTNKLDNTEIEFWIR